MDPWRSRRFSRKDRPFLYWRRLVPFRDNITSSSLRGDDSMPRAED